MWHKPSFERKLAQLLAILVFFSITLSAMQVGLAVDGLASKPSFRRISYAFAVFSMFIVMFVTITSVLGWMMLSFYDFVKVGKFRKTSRSNENA